MGKQTPTRHAFTLESRNNERALRRQRTRRCVYRATRNPGTLPRIRRNSTDRDRDCTTGRVSLARNKLGRIAGSTEDDLVHVEDMLAFKSF